MRRHLALILAAVVILVSGAALFVVFDPRRLASDTLAVGDSFAFFEIREQDGGIYVSAREVQIWRAGWHITERLGAVDEIGTENATIVEDVTQGLVELRVGQLKVQFDTDDKQFRWPKKQSPRSPAEVVLEWDTDDHYRAYYPTGEDVTEFRNALPASLDVLREALQHPARHVRRNATAVISELGPQAITLAPDLRSAYSREAEVGVLLWAYVQAIGSLGDRSPEVATFLRAEFARTEEPVLRTYLAGALVGATDQTTEPAAWAWLLASLEPGTKVEGQWPFRPRAEDDEQYTDEEWEQIEKFWDRRNAASLMLGKMGRSAQPALQRMEALLSSPHTTYNTKRRLLQDMERIAGNHTGE